MSQASIEWIAGVVRYHEAGGSYRDLSPYSWAGSVVKVDDRTVELKGMDRPVTRKIARAVSRALADEGFAWCIRRRPDGSVRWIDLNTGRRQNVSQDVPKTTITSSVGLQEILDALDRFVDHHADRPDCFCRRDVERLRRRSENIDQILQDRLNRES